MNLQLFLSDRIILAYLSLLSAVDVIWAQQNYDSTR